MTQEEKDTLLHHLKIIRNSCNEILEENKEMEKRVNFLINEYHTNKGYFRDEPGKVTIEDVIKTSFEFGWSSRRIYESKYD